MIYQIYILEKTMDIFQKIYFDTIKDFWSAKEYRFLGIFLLWLAGFAWLMFWYFWVLVFAGIAIGIISWICFCMIIIIIEEYQKDFWPKITKKPLRLIVSLIIMVIVFWVIDDMTSRIFLILLSWGIIWQIDNRVAASIALWILALIIVLLIFGFEEKANILAIWLYYFLVISVISSILQNTNKSDNIDNITP